MITKKEDKIFITCNEDLLHLRWKVEECPTENCWCAIIATEGEVYWDLPLAYGIDEYEEAYIASTGCIPKELAEHLVKIHNESLV